MQIVKIIIAGDIFLVLTIFVNILAGFFKLTSWYEFLNTVSSSGIEKALSGLSPVSLLWLFVGYPFTLGIFVYILRRML